MSNILIIDDEELICWFLQKELQGEGHEVFIATSGLEGVEKFKIVQPQYVITDLKLPDISGFDVIKEIKNINPDVKFIAMTAHKWEEVDKNDFKNSVVGFFEKPLNVSRLKEMLPKVWQ